MAAGVRGFGNCSREGHVRGDVRRREKKFDATNADGLYALWRGNYDALGDAIMREAEAIESIAPARREIASRPSHPFRGNGVTWCQAT
jgi:hypothetical protein